MITGHIPTALFLWLSTQMNFSFAQSTFLKAVHEVINFNSDCHIFLILQQPFMYNVEIKSPLSIQTFENPKGSINNNMTLRLKQNPPISVMNIKGIHCIYAVVIRVQPESQGNYTASSEQLFLYGLLHRNSRSRFDPPLTMERREWSVGILKFRRVH